MKKIFAILGLIAVLGITTPAMAAPNHCGHNMHGGGGMHPPMTARVHRGYPAPPPPPAYYSRPHSGIAFYGNYPRHSYGYGYRTYYWGDPWCDYQLGWYDGPYYRPYVPMGGFGVNIRF